MSDEKTFAEREQDSPEQTVKLLDPKSLTYQQVNTHRGLYRLTKTYVTDPARNVVLIDVRFDSLSGTPYRLHVLHDPALSNGPMDDSGLATADALLASDSKSASALVGTPGFSRTSSGFEGASDGWSDLRTDFRMDWAYRSAPQGNVVQTARLDVSGKPDSNHVTLALGFGPSTAAALGAARASLAEGFDAARAEYADGWHEYLADKPAPDSVASSELHEDTYNVSLMTLAAHEDKTYRGAYIASPSMPWVWRTDRIENPSGAYHLVWSRDLYQIATALLAAGDRGVPSAP